MQGRCKLHTKQMNSPISSTALCSWEILPASVTPAADCGSQLSTLIIFFLASCQLQLEAGRLGREEMGMQWMSKWKQQRGENEEKCVKRRESDRGRQRRVESAVIRQVSQWFNPNTVLRYDAGYLLLSCFLLISPFSPLLCYASSSLALNNTV